MWKETVLSLWVSAYSVLACVAVNVYWSRWCEWGCEVERVCRLCFCLRVLRSVCSCCGCRAEVGGRKAFYFVYLRVIE